MILVKKFKFFESQADKFDLLKYFSNSFKSEAQASFFCERCNKNIPEAHKDSHEDFHFAIEIDKSLNPNKRKYRL